MKRPEVRHNLMVSAIILVLLCGIMTVQLVHEYVLSESAAEPIDILASGKAGAKSGAFLLKADTLSDNTASKWESGKASLDSISVPKVLQGTEPPDGLQVNEEGRLVVSFKLRQVMDYFAQLMGVEDVPQESAWRLARQYLENKLEEPALSEAMDLLQRYWEYSEYVNGLQQHPEIEQAKASFHGRYEQNALASVELFHDERSRLQRELFSPEEVDAFFAEEQRYDQFMLAQIRLGRSGLGESELRMMSANLEQALSPEQRSHREQTLLIQRYKQLMQKEGMHPGLGTWYQEVSRELGSDVADKMARVEREKQGWEQKKSAYLARKDVLLSRSGISPQDVSQHLDQIMREELGFNDFEMRRMQALEGRLPK
ncbi:lipase secretion chaperone [Hahella ganghwensis]|uniref:lipase secretion chaperone n=1 Tax=Hahella ganghwensis TaxID=286420 RepID=UPI00035EEE42|nr:lipase secretion chaperone [Hahella ganghwensis]